MATSSRLAYLAPDANALVHLDNALLATAGLDLSISLARETTLNVSLGFERPIASGEGRIRAARSIDESGRIHYDDIVMDQGYFLRFDRVGLVFRRRRGPNASYDAGVTAVRNGFGDTEAIAGAKADIRF